MSKQKSTNRTTSKRTRRSFSDEYNREAVKLVTEQGCKLPAAATIPGREDWRASSRSDASRWRLPSGRYIKRNTKTILARHVSTENCKNRAFPAVKTWWSK